VTNSPGMLKSSTIFFTFSVLNYLARFLISILIARSLGPNGKGIYTLVITTASLLVLLVNIGLNGAFTYLIASKKFPAQLVIRYSLVITLILSVLGSVAFVILYNQFLSETILKDVSPSLLLIILFLLPVILFTSFLASILLGLQDIIRFNLVDTVRIWSNLALQLGLFLIGGGLIGAVIAWAVSNVVALMLSVWFLRTKLSGTSGKIWSITKSAFSYGIKGYVANLLTFFNYRLDTYMVNFYINPASVGIYSTGVGAAELLWFMPNSISSALFPKTPTLDRSAAIRLTSQACRLTIFFMLPASIFFGLAGIFLIPRLYGQEFRPSVIPFLLLLPGIIAISISKILSANLSGLGKPQYATIASFATVMITLILDITLIPRYGINGAAVASSVAYGFSAVCLLVYFLRLGVCSFGDVVLVKLDDIMAMRNIIVEKTRILRRKNI
jgi:O-antigen/teichoic acid export membrane protein